MLASCAIAEVATSADRVHARCLTGRDGTGAPGSARGLLAHLAVEADSPIAAHVVQFALSALTHPRNVDVICIYDDDAVADRLVPVRFSNSHGSSLVIQQPVLAPWEFGSCAVFAGCAFVCVWHWLPVAVVPETCSGSEFGEGTLIAFAF